MPRRNRGGPLYDLKDELREFFAGVYEIEDELRGGGMSRLFLASDASLRRKVVIKILPPDFSTETTAARFKREAQLTARLQHPHILPIISAGSANDLLYYVMPYVEGESLRARMEREGALAVPEAIRLLLEIADALAHAHAQGVIHRDIKPENILLQGGHAVVADFGIAGALDSGTRARLSGPTRLTHTGISLGTIGYMAPEQAVGERGVDATADVYSLGVVGYEMIAGRRLFEGESAQGIVTAHLTQKPVPLDQTADGVPTPVVMAIEKALAKDPKDRFQSAAEFRDALQAQVSPMTTMTRAVPAALIRAAKRRATLLRSRRMFAAIAVVVVIAAVAGGWWRAHRAATAPTDVVRVAVVPFDVVGEEPIWREGIVDLMSRDLDGAGTLHTVAPAVIVRGWSGKSDRDAAAAAAKKNGAAYAVYGSIFASQGNAVTLTASLLDVTRDSVIVAEIKRRGAGIPLLADSLAMVVIDELSKRNRLGAVKNRPAPQGTSSVAALRYFLQGEQQYRNTNWDSALVAFELASEADSGFALALHRRFQILGWMRNVDDSIAKSLALRAGRANRGLAPRDSLLVAADSLNAVATKNGLVNWSVVPKLFELLNRAVATYPDDPEAWFLLGEARYHLGYGRPLGVTDQIVLDAFDRSIALDSSFGPAYLHTAEVALQVRGRDASRNYAALYVNREPNGTDAKALRLVGQLLDPASASSASAQRAIDTLPWDDLHRAFLNLRRWPDSAASALRILNAASRRPRNATPYAPDTNWLRAYLPLELAFRGRMNDAFALTRNTPTRLLPELAYLGAIPADTAAPLFHAWLSTNNPRLRSALPWWAERHDTVSLKDFSRRADSVLKATSSNAQARGNASYNLAAASAYLALAHGDSATALARLATLSDTACDVCYLDRLMQAKLSRARGDRATAEALLVQRVATLLTPIEVLIALERGELAVEQGKSDVARRNFSFVIDAWGGGDPSLTPYVRRARAGLDKVTGRTVSAVAAQR